MLQDRHFHNAETQSKKITNGTIESVIIPNLSLLPRPYANAAKESSKLYAVEFIKNVPMITVAKKSAMKSPSTVAVIING